MTNQQIQEKERNNHIIISILSEVVGLKNGESRKHILSVSRITELLLSRVMQRTSRYHLTWQDEALITILPLSMTSARSVSMRRS